MGFCGRPRESAGWRAACPWPEHSPQGCGSREGRLRRGVSPWVPRRGQPSRRSFVTATPAQATCLAVCPPQPCPAHRRHTLVLPPLTTVTQVGGKSSLSLFSRVLKDARVPGVDVCVISETTELLSRHLGEWRRCHCVRFRARLISPFFSGFMKIRVAEGLEFHGPRKNSEQACQPLRTGTSRP